MSKEQKEREAFFEYLAGYPPRADSPVDDVVECNPDTWAAWQARANIAAHEATKPGWISIAERLPKKYEEVMVWPQPTGYCMTGTLGDSGWTYGEYETGWGHVDAMMSDPTHWMPLPTPPDQPSA